MVIDDVLTSNQNSQTQLLLPRTPAFVAGSVFLLDLPGNTCKVPKLLCVEFQSRWQDRIGTRYYFIPTVGLAGQIS